jgi:hypothetical protein
LCCQFFEERAKTMKGNTARDAANWMIELPRQSLTSKVAWATYLKSALGAFLLTVALLGLGCSGEAAPTAQEGEGHVRQVTAQEVAANPQEPASVTVTDIAGRTVTVKQPVERIILGEGRQMYIIAALEPDDPFTDP